MYLRTASWSDTSNPIPFTELREVVRRLDNPGPGLVQYLEQYLNLIGNYVVIFSKTLFK